MTFKRLYNMTGNDPALNRRIASIFLSELDAFRKKLEVFSTDGVRDTIQLVLFKLSPSFIIFEKDHLLKKIEGYINSAEENESKEERMNTYTSIQNDLNEVSNELKQFLSAL